MTTAKSFSDKGRGLSVFQSALRRQLPFLIVTAILMFIVTVVPYLVGAPDHMQHVYDWGNADAIRQYYAGTFSGIYLSEGQSGFMGVMLAVMSFGSALSAARFLHSKKMTDLYHALPVRRERMLLVNLGASMTAIMGPYLIIYILTMLGQLAVYGRFGWVNGAYFAYLAMDLGTTAALVWVIYALTTLVAVNVGTTFDALAVTGTLMFLPSAVYDISGLVWHAATYGAYFDGRYTLRLSPFLFFFERFNNVQYSHGYRQGYHNYPAIIAVFAVWFLLGCLLLGGAILCYRRRKSEIAEQTQPSGIFQMIVKCFAVFCGGALFLAMFSHRSVPVRLIAILLGGLGVGLIAELILSRSVRSVPKNIKWLALAGGVCCMLYLGLQFDLFGYQTRIPAASEVMSVGISYRGQYQDDTNPNYILPEPRGYGEYTTMLEDPANIAIVLQTHSSLLEQHKARDRNSYGVLGYHYAGSLRLSYRLSNGSTMVRYYNSGDGQAYSALAQLEDRREFITQNSPVFFMEGYDAAVRVSVAVVPTIGAAGWEARSLEESEMNRLIDALQNDMLRQPLEEILNPTQKAEGYLQLVYHDDALREYGYREYMPAAVSETIITYSYDTEYMDTVIADDPTIVAQTWVPLTSGYSETLTLLRELGLDELLATDPGKVSEVRITDLFGTYFYYNANAVRRLTPASVSDFYWRFNDREQLEAAVFSVTEPAEIEALAEAGVGAMYLDGQMAGRVMAMQYYNEAGAAVGLQLVRVEDLPDSVRAVALQYLEERANAFRDDIIFATMAYSA